MSNPRTFLVVLVKPIRRSQKPPNQGALLGMNCHSTPCLLRESCSDGERKSDLSSSAAERNMDALSEIIFFGWDLQLAKCIEETLGLDGLPVLFSLAFTKTEKVRTKDS